MKPSAEYQRALAEATEHHASSKTYSGKFLRPHAPFVKRLIDRHCYATVGGQRIGHRPVLDYGCGKGVQYEWVSHGDDASIPKGMTIEQFWGVPVAKYDPAWPPFAQDPENRRGFAAPPYGVTLMTHVAGSIPLQDLTGWVLPRIAAMTTGAIYIAEKLGEVGKDVFSDTTGLPRWNEGEWRGFMRAQSYAPWSRDVELVLSLRRREGDQAIVERWTYTDGEERSWP